MTGRNRNRRQAVHRVTEEVVYEVEVRTTTSSIRLTVVERHVEMGEEADGADPW